MSRKLEASRVSRRGFLRLGGAAALGAAAAGNGLFAPASVEAQEITYPYKTWQVSGQDAFILADEATQTYYQYTTGGPAARQSKDLVNWSAAYSVWNRPPEDQRWYARTSPWACEVHQYNGKYYLFATFHNSGTVLARSELATTPNPSSIWHSQWARATTISVADSPMGPFVGLDDSRPAHDPRFMTLDGTLVVDEEGPWMVYCHEWIQKMDGTIEAIPLTEDLSAAAGDPILLFRGSDASWRNRPKGSTAAGVPVINASQNLPCVTDGCEFYRTPSGYLLMLWTGPGGSYSYTELQAISRSGKVRGPWEQIYRQPLAYGNRGHGMIFWTFEGQAMFLVMNRSAPVGGGSRMEFYEVEITDEGVEILAHRDDLDGQPGMDLTDAEPPDLFLPPNQVVDATSPEGAVVTYTAMAHDWQQGPVPLNSSHASSSTFAIGDTAVTCWAEDDAHNTATATFDVHVKGAAEQISDQIALVLLAKPKGTSFVDQLESAQALLAEGRNREACEKLNAFINHVRAQSGKQLSVSLANKLIANATRIIAVIGG